MKPDPWPVRLLLCVALLACALPLRAELGLSMGAIEGAGWRAQGVEARLSGAGPDYALALTARQLVLPGALGVWSQVRLHCVGLQREADAWTCPQLTLAADTPQGRQDLSGSLRYTDAEHWSLQLDRLRLVGGRWRVRAQADGAWQAELNGSGLTLAALLRAWPGWSPPDWGWAGGVQARARLSGRGGGVGRVELTATLKQGAWSSPDGLQAAEKLAGRLLVDARQRAGRWLAHVSTDWRGGQLYTDPLYLELAAHPLSLAGDLRWPAGGERVELDGMRLLLGTLMTVDGDAELPLAKPTALDGRFTVALPDLEAAYPVLGKPFGYGGVLGGLRVTGDATLTTTVAAGAPQLASLRLGHVDLADGEERFGLDDLNGLLRWQAQGAPPPSRLRWRGGHLYRMALGGAGMGLLLQGDTLALTQPLDLPILDGRLRVPRLSAKGVGTEHPVWDAELAAEQLSLPALSEAFGWPRLAGELSVEIPALHYADQVVTLDGALVAKAFDGSVRITGLQLEQPLSAAPVLRADATLQGLDLERITRVFDFGRITGRLEGRVDGLELVGWQPVAFQALLQNPPDDDLPHRISQRAVDNLTALGNNGAAALSGTFLRFFESFTYDRLMLRVNLQGTRARLDGMPHSGGGYYLVKGAGLPRIDVIGRNRDVAWRDLVARLKGVQLKGAQVR